MSRDNHPAFKRTSCYCPRCMTRHLLKVHVYHDRLRIHDMTGTCDDTILPRDPQFEQHYLPKEFLASL